MFHCQKGDIFRYKGEIAECIEAQHSNVTIKVNDVHVMIDLLSEEFQKNVKQVRTLRFSYSHIVTLDNILKLVCEHFNLPTNFVIGKSRKKPYVEARHIAMYLSREHTNQRLKAIGLFFGCRDHTTVIHAIHHIEAILFTKDYLAIDVRALECQVTNLIDANNLLLKNVS